MTIIKLYESGYSDGLNGCNPRQLAKDERHSAYADGVRHGFADRNLPTNETPRLFSLEREPAILPKRPTPIRSNERSRQLALITGLDCVAGQQDLFAVDGEAR